MENLPLKREVSVCTEQEGFWVCVLGCKFPPERVWSCVWLNLFPGLFFNTHIFFMTRKSFTQIRGLKRRVARIRLSSCTSDFFNKCSRERGGLVEILTLPAWDPGVHTYLCFYFHIFRSWLLGNTDKWADRQGTLYLVTSCTWQHNMVLNVRDWPKESIFYL